jgi:hypothetical protein
VPVIGRKFVNMYQTFMLNQTGLDYDDDDDDINNDNNNNNNAEPSGRAI